MIALVSGTTKTVRRLAAKGVTNLGRLLTPGNWASMDSVTGDNLPWACDNGAFSGFDDEQFKRFLLKISGYPGCLFVAVPDVVGNAKATIDRFSQWGTAIRDIGHPLAFVLQDGQEHLDLPFADAYFIGGSTRFKVSSAAFDLVKHGKKKNPQAWIHMGRVNSNRRIAIAKEMGCDSFDGSSMSMFGDVYVERFCRHAAKVQVQQRAW